MEEKPLFRARDLGTVGELIDALAAYPRGTRIVLSADAEGNSYSPLASAEEGMYEPDSSWSGSVRPTLAQCAAGIYEPEECGDGDCRDACTCEVPGEEHAIVLTPTN